MMDVSCTAQLCIRLYTIYLYIYMQFQTFSKKIKLIVQNISRHLASAKFNVIVGYKFVFSTKYCIKEHKQCFESGNEDIFCAW